MNRFSILYACVVAISAATLATPAQAEKITIGTVHVGDAGNLTDKRPQSYGYGGVDYEYDIGKYEVTAGQYAAFLNAVAATDTYGLYNSSMNGTYGCGIVQSGSSGNYTYSVSSGKADRPVNYVSWGDAARFSNWINNGQPTGAQGNSTTETGAYALNGATTAAELCAVSRSAGWKWALPTEDEWYKAAYYNRGVPATTSGTTYYYYRFPTASDTGPGNSLTGSGKNANYRGTGSYPIDSPYYTTQGGQFATSESPYGTFDQGGNVAEWNELVSGTARGYRGGDFTNTNSDRMLSSSAYTAGALYEGFFIGFRMVSSGIPVPEPGTLALLVCCLSGLVCYAWRKRK